MQRKTFQEIESYLNDKSVFGENAPNIDSIRGKFNETENHESFDVNEFVRQVTLLKEFIDVRTIKAAIKTDHGNEFFLRTVIDYSVINHARKSIENRSSKK